VNAVHFRVDMYVEGARDIGDLLLSLHFLPAEDRENSLKNIRKKYCSRCYPVFEKVEEYFFFEYS